MLHLITDGSQYQLLQHYISAISVFTTPTTSISICLALVSSIITRRIPVCRYWFPRFWYCLYGSSWPREPRLLRLVFNFESQGRRILNISFHVFIVSGICSYNSAIVTNAVSPSSISIISTPAVIESRKLLNPREMSKTTN